MIFAGPPEPGLMGRLLGAYSDASGMLAGLADAVMPLAEAPDPTPSAEDMADLAETAAARPHLEAPACPVSP